MQKRVAVLHGVVDVHTGVEEHPKQAQQVGLHQVSIVQVVHGLRAHGVIALHVGIGSRL
jgi:hypothetical protein